MLSVQFYKELADKHTLIVSKHVLIVGKHVFMVV